MKLIRIAFLILSAIVFTVPSLYAQRTVVYASPDHDFSVASDLFYKEKFGAARIAFEKILQLPNLPYGIKSNAEFFTAASAAELYNNDAEPLLLAFIEHYPEHSHVESARLALGSLNYRQKKYKRAIEYFEKVDPSRITDNERYEYYFRLGYSYYMTNQYEKAAAAFFNVIDTDSKYATAATYYYAHMQYVNKNYEASLKYFLKLKDSESFGSLVPYYITQIYYRQGKYEEVLKYAPSRIDSGNTKNGLEIERIIGESYYRKGGYKDAIPYLSDYEKNSGATTNADIYCLAYSYYKTAQYEKAISYFQKITSAKDSLSQYAYYHLADCNLKSGNKRNARSAFQSAGQLKFNETITEESKFNFAKLTYELALENAAIDAFRIFLKEYPESTHRDEANELLVDVYATTHNYKDALEAVSKVKVKTQKVRTAYQKVAYFRGVQLYNDNQNKEAVDHFNIAINNPQDVLYVALAKYWKGESQYRMAQLDEAIKSYSDFLYSPGAVNTSVFATANYNLGYAYFKQEDYKDALSWFRKYAGDKKISASEKYNDALLRIADCFFVLKDAGSASDYYQQAISNKARSSDYAFYQKAVISGVQGNMNQKISQLQSLMDKYPKSGFYDDALYEAGDASLIVDRNEQALSYFKKLTANFPKSPYYKKALIKQGIAYENTDKDELAIETYKGVIAQYPNTEEFKEALNKLEVLYVEKNKVDEFLAYTKTIPGASDTYAGKEDSLMYISAEYNYTTGNCDKAVPSFDAYISKYPSGQYILNAQYYRADCLYRNKKAEDALSGFEYVITKPQSRFTEPSLLNAALILYSQNQYQASGEYFEQLVSVAKDKDNQQGAVAGVMRCNFKIANYAKAAAAAEKVIEFSTDKVLINEAHFIIGCSAMEANDIDKAKKELGFIAKKNAGIITAEAKYRLAVIEYNLTNYKESQKIIFEIAKMDPSYDYWVAKGFILLGDCYVAQKDFFQAKETYKSIIDNYNREASDADDVKTIATQKYNALNASEEGGQEKKNPNNEKQEGE